MTRLEKKNNKSALNGNMIGAQKPNKEELICFLLRPVIKTFLLLAPCGYIIIKIKKNS